MSNVVYISGQITGLKKTIYEHRFKKAEIHLKCKIKSKWHRVYVYSDVINPLNIRPLFGIKRWFFFMVADIWVLINKSDTIYMLNNYKWSKGSKIELWFAKLFNKKIEYEL